MLDNYKILVIDDDLIHGPELADEIRTWNWVDLAESVSTPISALQWVDARAPNETWLVVLDIQIPFDEKSPGDTRLTDAYGRIKKNNRGFAAFGGLVVLEYLNSIEFLKHILVVTGVVLRPLTGYLKEMGVSVRRKPIFPFELEDHLRMLRHSLEGSDE